MRIKDRYESSILNILFKMCQIKAVESFSLMQIEKLQQRRLKKLLRHAVDNSEFYRDYYKKSGINVEKIEDVKLEELPMIDKQIMMDNFDKLVCDKTLKKSELEEFIDNKELTEKKYKESYEIVHTSGSSGKVGIFVYGPNDWTTIKALVIVRVSKLKLKLFNKTKLAFLGAIDGHYAGINLKRDAPKFLFDFLPLDINKPIEETVVKLNNYMPDNLSGYSSGIHLLALEQLKGNLNIKPNRIVCSADPLTHSMSLDIYKAFGVKPTNFYAATESIGMASECDDGDGGLHMFTDLHIFEIINKDGESVENGNPGNIVLTNLYNYTQPLIRYKMDDEVIVDETENKCHWPFPVISKLCGREEEVLWFKKTNGEEVFLHPLVFIELRIQGLEKLQVIETYHNKLKFNVVISGDKDRVKKILQENIDEILSKKNLTDTVSYEIVLLKEISSDSKTGKFRGVITLKDNHL